MLRRAIHVFVVLMSSPFASEVIFEDETSHAPETEYVLPVRPKCRGMAR